MGSSMEKWQAALPQNSFPIIIDRPHIREWSDRLGALVTKTPFSFFEDKEKIISTKFPLHVVCM